MADGPTPERVERVLSFLAHTTGTGVDYLYPEPRRRPGVLDGEGILEIWRAFQEDDETLSPFKLTTQLKLGRSEPYGLYFLFYLLGGQTVPLYVGKGRLPYRPLAHLGLQNQYLDQMMARYFGGVHGRPWRQEDNQPFIRERLGRLRLGFCFYAVGAPSEAKKSAASYERQFIDALHPVGNSGYYPPRIEHFELAEAAAAWPENGRGKPSLGAAGIDELIAACLDTHDRCLAAAS